MSISFKVKMEQASQEKESNIVLALDLPLNDPDKVFARARKILQETHSEICAVKLNRHLVLPLGVYSGLRDLLTLASNYELQTIMDCKINDIGNTNRIIAEHYFNAGFGAVTANPFVGWEEGLEPVFALARQLNRGVILLVYMSHKAAWEGYGQQTLSSHDQKTISQYIHFAQKTLKWNADGAVVGATYPEKIQDVFTILKEKVPIYSPGIGVQGGVIDNAIRSGARYLIVGRSITMADNPNHAARSFNRMGRNLKKHINKEKTRSL
ncbi:MAG: orotidine 5'-phosphate decarboxylase [Candidatus Bathyarchaeota archaeon]|nr:orotidine 5'-phosphate decarboxylase [Candidatus Bathyarchaeota archaeon]